MSCFRVLLAIIFPPLAVVDKGCGSFLITFILTTALTTARVTTRAITRATTKPTGSNSMAISHQATRTAKAAGKDGKLFYYVTKRQELWTRQPHYLSIVA